VAGRSAGPAWRVAIAIGGALAILGVSVVALLDPAYIHAALDAAGSAAILGLDRQATYAASDRTMNELVFGPATFAFRVAPGGPPFYDASEASHLRDASNLLHLFLVVVVAGAVLLVVGVARNRRDPAAWRALRTGAIVLAAAFAAIGLFFTVAFDQAFTLFHEVFFPQGNWEFNSATERMVQLYPTPFWELIATTLAILVLAICGLVWLVATLRARSLDQGAAIAAAGPAGPAVTPALNDPGAAGRADGGGR
jgi:integral membrane protein (TIGR01906 family)